MSESQIDPMEEYFFYVGLLAGYWNKAESELDDLLASFIGNAEKAHILTGGTNVAKRLANLRSIVKTCHANDDWLPVMLSALDAFDVLRQNRNTIIHGTATRLKMAEGVVELRAATKHPTRKTYRYVQLNKDGVTEQLEQVIQLVKHMAKLRSHIFYRRGPIRTLGDLANQQGPLPDIFPTPKLLPDPPIQSTTEQQAQPLR